jgi:hypothetical protein
MFKGRFWTGLLLLILQLTVIGWLPATVVAFFIISDANKSRALADAVRQVNEMKGN